MRPEERGEATGFSREGLTGRSASESEGDEVTAVAGGIDNRLAVHKSPFLLVVCDHRGLDDGESYAMIEVVIAPTEVVLHVGAVDAGRDHEDVGSSVEGGCGDEDLAFLVADSHLQGAVVGRGMDRDEGFLAHFSFFLKPWVCCRF